MKLTDLEPEWIVTGNSQNSIRRSDELTIETAQGVMFLDPIEFTKNGGPIGTSSVICWFFDRGVDPNKLPGPGRWSVIDSDFHDLTLNPSVDLSMGGKHPGWWHGWIKNGEVT